jgi:hypothetical protein
MLECVHTLAAAYQPRVRLDTQAAIKEGACTRTRLDQHGLSWLPRFLTISDSLYAGAPARLNGNLELSRRMNTVSNLLARATIIVLRFLPALSVRVRYHWLNALSFWKSKKRQGERLGRRARARNRSAPAVSKND